MNIVRSTLLVSAFALAAGIAGGCSSNSDDDTQAPSSGAGGSSGASGSGGAGASQAGSAGSGGTAAAGGSSGSSAGGSGGSAGEGAGGTAGGGGGAGEGAGGAAAGASGAAGDGGSVGPQFKETGSVMLPKAANQIAYDPATNLVWASYGVPTKPGYDNAGAIVAIDPKTSAITKTVMTEKEPFELVVDPAHGKVYGLVHSGASAAYEVDESTGALSKTISVDAPGMFLKGLAVDGAAGKLYVGANGFSFTDPGAILAVDIASATTSSLATVSAGTSVSALAVDPTKHLLYVTEHGPIDAQHPPATIALAFDTMSSSMKTMVSYPGLPVGLTVVQSNAAVATDAPGLHLVDPADIKLPDWFVPDVIMPFGTELAVLGRDKDGQRAVVYVDLEAGKAGDPVVIAKGATGELAWASAVLAEPTLTLGDIAYTLVPPSKCSSCSPDPSVHFATMSH